jgi:hypothetical protein
LIEPCARLDEAGISNWAPSAPLSSHHRTRRRPTRLFQTWLGTGVLLSLLRDVLPRKYARFVPSAMAMGLPFYIGRCWPAWAALKRFV